MTLTIETRDVRMDDLEQLVERARQGALSDSEYETLKAVVQTLGHVAELLATHGTTLADLRRLLLAQQGTTENTRTVLARAGIAGDAEPASGDSSDPPTPRDRPQRFFSWPNTALPASAMAPCSSPAHYGYPIHTLTLRGGYLTTSRGDGEIGRARRTWTSSCARRARCGPASSR